MYVLLHPDKMFNCCGVVHSNISGTARTAHTFLSFGRWQAHAHALGLLHALRQQVSTVWWRLHVGRWRRLGAGGTKNGFVAAAHLSDILPAQGARKTQHM